jgi:hypothetical protein
MYDDRKKKLKYKKTVQNIDEPKTGVGEGVAQAMGEKTGATKMKKVEPKKPDLSSLKTGRPLAKRIPKKKTYEGKGKVVYPTLLDMKKGNLKFLEAKRKLTRMGYQPGTPLFNEEMGKMGYKM